MTDIEQTEARMREQMETVPASYTLVGVGWRHINGQAMAVAMVWGEGLPAMFLCPGCGRWERAIPQAVQA